jgi:GNAT superfamily N-acetyltransferase
MNGPVVIREISAADADAAARLSEELGYPVSAGVMAQRIDALNALPDHAVYVACVSGETVGLIHVMETRHLTAEARAEIAGLVVASEVRSRGIGRHLVARAERWALERGLTDMIVRSRSTREAAHRFYLREGYRQTKISAVFTKELAGSGTAGS